MQSAGDAVSERASWLVALYWRRFHVERNNQKTTNLR